MILLINFIYFRTTYDHMIYWGLNEADWPHRSWGTGHLNDTTGDCAGPLDSIYLNLYNRVCKYIIILEIVYHSYLFFCRIVAILEIFKILVLMELVQVL